MCIDALKRNGVLTLDELRQRQGYPTQAQFVSGPTVVMECIEQIPCNPCETACPRKAITVGSPITNLPMINYSLCVACGMCISACPGLAIYIKDFTYGPDTALISFPYEYAPLPSVGENVVMVNRKGEPQCTGRVLRVANGTANKKTAVITAVFDKTCFDNVVNMLPPVLGGKGCSVSQNNKKGEL